MHLKKNLMCSWLWNILILLFQSVVAGAFRCQTENFLLRHYSLNKRLILFKVSAKH